MATAPTEAPSQEKLLFRAYDEILGEPFEKKYEDKWEEESYWAAVEKFKARCLEIGFEDPFVILSKYRVTSFEQIRDKFKAGPPACFREGWKSILLGEKLDPIAIIAPLEHVNGPKYSGEERIVVLDFWATWCGPCVEAAPELSDLAEKYAGRVAIVGINNEFKEYDIQKVRDFLEKRKESFRYTVYVDTPEGLAKNSVYVKCEYRAIPCVVLVVDGVVSYVGAPEGGFNTALEEAVRLVSAKEE